LNLGHPAQLIELSLFMSNIQCREEVHSSILLSVYVRGQK